MSGQSPASRMMEHHDAAENEEGGDWGRPRLGFLLLPLRNTPVFMSMKRK